LYAVAPPPFIAPEYQKIVDETHGRSYNIITEEGHFAELVRQIGHSIATQYSLTYRTPRPIEDGTNRSVELQIDYNGQTATASTSYQVRGIGGAAINVPEGEGAPGQTEGVALNQFSFKLWNGVVPLIAVLALLGLSQLRFGVSQEELKAIVDAQAAPPPAAAPRPLPRFTPGAPPPRAAPPASVAAVGASGPRLQTLNPIAPIASEYAVLKDEVSLGRGEDNDIVIPHASVSRTHARLLKRNGAYELTDLNSTNGSFVDDRQIRGSTVVTNGSQVRLGDIRFVLHY